MTYLEACRQLALPPFAFSPGDLKRAYFRQARRWHPDRFPWASEAQERATEIFKQVHAAFEFLTRHGNAPAGEGSGVCWTSGGQRRWRAAGHARRRRNPFSAPRPSFESRFPYNMGLWIVRVMLLAYAVMFLVLVVALRLGADWVQTIGPPDELPRGSSVGDEAPPAPPGVHAPAPRPLEDLRQASAEWSDRGTSHDWGADRRTRCNVVTFLSGRIAECLGAVCAPRDRRPPTLSAIRLLLSCGTALP